MKAPHLESFIQAHRIQLIDRFLDVEYQSIWKFFLHHYLRKVGSTFLFQCYFDVDKLAINLPAFYDDCIGIWRAFNNPGIAPTSKSEVLNEIIWNNQNLCVNGKFVYIAKLTKGGITRISDITNVRGELREWSDLTNSFPVLNISDYLRLGGLFSSFPVHWKTALRCNIIDSYIIGSQSPRETETHSGSIFLKKIYWSIIAVIALKPTAQLKYQEIYLNFEFRLDEMKFITVLSKLQLTAKQESFNTRFLIESFVQTRFCAN